MTDPREPLDRKLAPQGGDDDGAVPRLGRTIDRDKVAIEDACARHRIAFDPKEEGSTRPRNQMGIEIDAPLKVIIGWRRKTGRDAASEQRQLRDWGALIRPADFRDLRHGEHMFTH